MTLPKSTTRMAMMMLVMVEFRCWVWNRTRASGESWAWRLMGFQVAGCRWWNGLDCVFVSSAMRQLSSLRGTSVVLGILGYFCFFFMALSSGLV